MVSEPPAAEGGDVAVLVHALEAGDHDHPPRLQVRPDALVIDADDACLVMGAVGADVDLMAGVRACGATLRLKRHREQRDGHLLAGREQDVELARVGGLPDAACEAGEAVRLAAHRGNDHHNVVASLAKAHDLRRDAGDPFEAPHGGASELLDDQGHRQR